MPNIERNVEKMLPSFQTIPTNYNDFFWFIFWNQILSIYEILGPLYKIIPPLHV